MQALDGFIWASGHLLFFILLFPLKYLWLEPKPMKLHGNTPVESQRLSNLGAEPCSEKKKKKKIGGKEKKCKKELVSLYDFYLPEIYMQHYK